MKKLILASALALAGCGGGGGVSLTPATTDFGSVSVTLPEKLASSRSLRDDVVSFGVVLSYYHPGTTTLASQQKTGNPGEVVNFQHIPAGQVYVVVNAMNAEGVVIGVGEDGGTVRVGAVLELSVVLERTTDEGAVEVGVDYADEQPLPGQGYYLRVMVDNHNEVDSDNQVVAYRVMIRDEFGTREWTRSRPWDFREVFTVAPKAKNGHLYVDVDVWALNPDLSSLYVGYSREWFWGGERMHEAHIILNHQS